VTRFATWVLGAIGVALAAALVAAARPAAIAALLARSRPLPVALALLLSVLVLALRGARLAVVAGARLGIGRAVAVQGVTSAAVALLPLRAGELVLIPLLRGAGVPGTLRGLSFLVSLRLLDAAGLLVWVVMAAAALGGRYGWAVLPLAAVPLAAAAAVALGLRAVRRFARRWRRRGGIRRSALRQLLQVRRELSAAARSPRRAGAALALSVAIWAGVWWLTVALVRGMGLEWPASAVLLGVIGASVGAALPINALGNFGTLEAGWTAALSALGVPAGEALAAGFATHLWSALFTAALGAGAAAYLWLARGRIGGR
jgi:uncharacterized membrane protein YbhN (UPF0104 family)